MKMKHVIGALAICMVAATAAQASTWVQYVSVKPGETVTIPGKTVWAGVYNLHVVWDGGTTAPTSGTDTDSFCVDVTDSSTTTWQIYNVVELENAPDPSGKNMGTAKANDIRQLFALAFLPAAVWHEASDSKAAAVQAAVWEIINEKAGTAYSLTNTPGETWWTTAGNEGTINTANGWLTTINTDNAVDGGNDLPLYPDLMVLTNETYQDFTIVRKGIPPVPEPLTMASAFFAIGGLGAYIRRRTGRAAA